MDKPRIVLSRQMAPTLAGWVIVILTVAAYSGSFSGPFVFDDTPSILGNPTIRHLDRLSAVLNPPYAGGVTVGGRPLVNLSLALNYAISGYRVWSYHLLNLAVHVLAGLTLFGLVRRTLVRGNRESGGGKTQARAGLAALTVALIWTLHPLQTESVTYMVQRAESMMGLFYLLTLYAFARAIPDDAQGGGLSTAQGFSRPWLVVSWFACLAGMASKEVMVSAPLLVFLYDRCFMAGSFRKAWSRRGKFHLALASTWLLLAGLVVRSGGNRGGSSGLGSPVPWATYVLSQFPAIVHYLRLVVWPHPLVFFYPVRWPSLAEAAPSALAVALLATGTAYALRKNLAMGFLGTWFFAILAPTSLIPGTGQTLAEHRMYLALAPVVAMAVAGVFWTKEACFPRWRARIVLLGLSGVAFTLAIGTFWRNRAYRTEFSLWSNTAHALPGNALAECNLGIAYSNLGDTAAAKSQFEKALTLLPDFPNALVNLGKILSSEGKLAEATADYERAVKLVPDLPEALVNLATLLCQQGRTREAFDYCERALKLRPLSPEAHESLALCLAQSGQPEQAIASHLRALQLQPNFPAADFNLANTLLAMGKDNQALQRYRDAVQLRPQFPEAHNGLGLALAKSGRLEESAAEYQVALTLKSDYAEAQYNYGNLLAQTGRLAAAEAAYRAALRLRPRFFEAEGNLANTLLSEGHSDAAIACYREILRFRPDSADIHYNLALALQAAGRAAEAAAQFHTAAQLKGKD